MPYSRKHYRLLSNGGPDTPGAIDARIRRRRAAERAVADREAKYPVMTAENAREAIAYQEERIRFHEAEEGV